MEVLSHIHEIDEMIKGILEEEGVSQIVLFGAGERGKEFLRETSLVNLIASNIYDNKAEGDKFYGNYKVLRPEKIVPNDSLIVITTVRDKEIAEQLNKCGCYRWCSLSYISAIAEINMIIKNPKIVTCMIESTSLCNAQCIFCSNPTLKRARQHMRQEIFEKIIERLKEEHQYPKIFRLHLLGEPLLDPLLFEKIRRLKEEFPDSSIGYTSNFNCATKDMIHKIFEFGQDYLVISLNSTEPNEYKRLMNLNYNKTIQNIEYLLEEKAERKSTLNITVSIVASQEDKETISAFSKKWEDKGVSVRVMYEGKWLEKQEDFDVNLSARDNQLIRKYAENGKSCCMLTQELCFFSNGDYAFCCFDAEGAYPLGNVCNTSIKEIYNSPVRRKTLVDLLDGYRLNMCKDCSFMY